MVNTKRFLKRIVEIGEGVELGLLKNTDIDFRALKKEAEFCLRLCAGCVMKDRQTLLKIRECVAKAGGVPALAKTLGVPVKDVKYLTIQGRCKNYKVYEWAMKNCEGISLIAPKEGGDYND